MQVFGIDDAFLRFHGLQQPAPRGREIWISGALGAELAARQGDDVVLRLARPSDIPLDTLQGRRDQSGERIRLSVARIAGRDALGEFSLAPSQAPALTMFVARERLQADLGLSGRANVLLFKGETAGDLNQRLRSSAALDDYGLRLRESPGARRIIVESRAGVINAALAATIQKAAAAMGATSDPVLVHLANTIRIGSREIPYSVVAGRPLADGIVLNEWAASALEAQPGEVVELDYFVWSDSEGLRTEHASFPFAGVVPMAEDGGDRTFTPEYPGLTDADDVSAWDPPFPVDLKRVA